jgi:hypothetical protein
MWIPSKPCITPDHVCLLGEVYKGEHLLQFCSNYNMVVTILTIFIAWLTYLGLGRMATSWSRTCQTCRANYTSPWQLADLYENCEGWVLLLPQEEGWVDGRREFEGGGRGWKLEDEDNCISRWMMRSKEALMALL